MQKSYRELFGGSLHLTLKSGAAILSDYPKSKKALAKVIKNLNAADKKRNTLFKEGTQVPPLIIVSTTDECNLRCSGCYSCEFKKDERKEITPQRKSEFYNEASDLGVGIIMLAGGEPLLSREWLDGLAAHPELLGIVFTNGTLFTKERVDWFNANRHIIPALSIEGDEQQTDMRRGAGVYKTVLKSMSDLKDAGVPFGVSITVTKDNLGNLLSDSFIDLYMDKGARMFIFVEYVPVAKSTESLVLSQEEKEKLQEFCAAQRKKKPALFIPFPGDEEPFGGCLAAGRGFLHINAGGAIEPCPFAPLSDVSINNMSLKQALSSNLLKKVRENHHLLKEGNGGCALWSNRALLEEMGIVSVKNEI